MGKSEKKTKKKGIDDDSVFSKNHHRNIKYRKRLQDDKEREQELKEFIKRKEHE